MQTLDMPNLVRFPRGAVTAHANAAGAWFQESQDRGQRGGLAGSVAAEQCMHLAGPDLQVQSIEDRAPTAVQLQ